MALTKRGAFTTLADRIGDTFRWKGENVSTLEVSTVLFCYPGIKNATVYGVEVPGCDGRAGMAAIETDESFELSGLYQHLARSMPAYAVPLFVRLVPFIETTETFKPKKQQLVGEGFNPAIIHDSLFVADGSAKKYMELTPERYMQFSATSTAA